MYRSWNIQQLLYSKIARCELVRIRITSVPVAAHLSDRASDPRRFGPDHLGVVRDDAAVALAVFAHEPLIRELDLAVPQMGTSVRHWCKIANENTFFEIDKLKCTYREAFQRWRLPSS